MRLNPYKSTFLLSGARHSKEVVNYSEDFSVETSFESHQKTVSSEYVDATFKEYLFDGVRIELRNINLKKELRIDVNHNFPFFKMHFEIEGSSSYSPKNKNSLPVFVSNGHHHLFFFPSVDGFLTYPAHTKRNTLEITLSLNFVSKVFKDNWEILEQLGDAIQQNKPFVFSPNSHMINAEIMLVIQQIANCKIDDCYKKAYLESKVIELLVLQLQDFKTDTEYYDLTAHNDAIIKSKEFISNNLNKKLTIPLIAKHVGINTQDLKKEFKLKYGTTIFKFITKKRMETAVELLKFTDSSIYDIANNVGYKYSQHFSKAFKKHFGVTPKYYRKAKS